MTRIHFQQGIINSKTTGRVIIIDAHVEGAGFRQHVGTVEKAMGVLLIVFGLLIATNSINYIAQWMLETFPVFSAIG